MDHLISARRPDLVIVNKKERTFQIVDVAVPADHKVNLKESEKRDKYWDFASEPKKLLETNLYRKNLIKEIHTWAVPPLCKILETIFEVIG